MLHPTDPLCTQNRGYSGALTLFRRSNLGLLGVDQFSNFDVAGGREDRVRLLNRRSHIFSVGC
jgi:hypothetical protein